MALYQFFLIIKKFMQPVMHDSLDIAYLLNEKYFKLNFRSKVSFLVVLRF